LCLLHTYHYLNQIMISKTDIEYMENYYVVESEDNPGIYCDAEKGIIEINGKSLPENVDTFYNPLIDWVKDYIQNPRSKTTIEFGFIYLNSSSSKKILEILMLLKSLLLENKLKIIWNYMMDDEDMLEEGKDFAKMTQLNFNFKAIS